MQHALTDAWLKSTLGHYVDWPAKQLSELELQPPEVKQGMAGIHVYEKVKVAISVGISARYRSKDPEVPRAVRSRYPEHALAQFQVALVE